MTDLTAHIVADSESWTIPVWMTNEGWKGSYYLTEFRFNGRTLQSTFHCLFKSQETCPRPDERMASDMEALERAIVDHYARIKLRITSVEIVVDEDVITTYDPTIPVIDRMRKS